MLNNTKYETLLGVFRASATKKNSDILKIEKLISFLDNESWIEFAFMKEKAFKDFLKSNEI